MSDIGQFLEDWTIMNRIKYLVVLLATMSIMISYPAAGQEIDKKFRIEPTRETLSADFFIDFFTLFAPDATTLNESIQRAAYDVLMTAAKRIEDGDYNQAADLLAVLPDEAEAKLQPVVTMREDLAASESIELFADKDAKAELMKYHREVWTAHPEFADDFNAFMEDFAKRASRREKDQGAPYIIDHLTDYGFTPKAGGGAQQSYLFLWTKFNGISKFAAVCDKLGLDYTNVKMKDYKAGVSRSLSDKIKAAKDDAYSREQGRMSWSTLIDTYAVPAEPTPEETTVEPLPPVDNTIEETPPEEIPEAAPVEPTPEPKGPSDFEILINPLSLFTPPSGVEATPKVEEPPAEPAEPEAEIEPVQPEEATPVQPAPPEITKPVETTPSKQGELPSTIDAIPVPPGTVSGTLAVGTPAGSGPGETSPGSATLSEDEARLELAKIAEDAIDNAANKALQLGREALTLAKLLIDDPKQEKDATKSQVTIFRDARGQFLAASALIDRYRLEEYLKLPVEMIEEEIVAEMRRPYDDLKASPDWDKYRGNEADFDKAFLRIATDFRQRRTSDSIYAGEMAALEARIVDYESTMLRVEELTVSLNG